MKKIFFLAPLFLSTLLLADSIDILEKVDLDVKYLSHNGISVSEPTLDGCYATDMRKLLTVTEKTIKNEPFDSFYLSMCEPFYKAYLPFKSTADALIGISITKNQIEYGELQYSQAQADNSKSYYVSLFTNLYRLRFSPEKRKILVGTSLFKNKTDEFSRYISYAEDRPRGYHGLMGAIPYNEYLFKTGDNFLNAESNILYNHVYSVMLSYLMESNFTRQNRDNYLKTLELESRRLADLEVFLKAGITEKEKRGLSPFFEYFKLAEMKFNKTLKFTNNSYDRSDIINKLKSSYRLQKFESQAILLEKILIKDFYIATVEEYNRSLSDIEEYEFITTSLDKLDNLNRLVPKEYLYAAKLRAFLSKKILFIKPNREYKRLAMKSLKIIKDLTIDELEKNAIEEVIRDIDKNRYGKLNKDTRF